MNSKDFRNIEDKELLNRFYADNNNEWLGILLQRYTLLLYGVCMKYLKNEEDAKDAVQQVFFKVIAELHKYKVDYFKSWLYMVAKNHCLMKLRGQKHVIELSDRHTEEPDNRKQELLENERTYSLLESAIEELNEEQKQCVILFYLQKKSYNEVSEQTGYSLLQVKSYIQNGKRNLKLLLEKKLKENGHH